MAALPSRADSPSRIQELTARVKHKYHKMPGLILTQAQAQRLFGLDGMTLRYCQKLCVTRDQAASFLMPSTKGTPSMTAAIS